MKRLRRVVPLAIILMAFWLLLSARATLANLLVGAVTTLVLAVVASFVIPAEFESHVRAGFALRLPVFAVLLMWEIIKANWDVWKRVMRPSLPIDPRIVKFDTCLESDTAKTVLAGAINLTPGTVTLDIDGPMFVVHCLALEHDIDLLDQRLERMVAWLFREGPPEARGLR